jgi:hypothetical protein
MIAIPSSFVACLVRSRIATITVLAATLTLVFGLSGCRKEPPSVDAESPQAEPGEQPSAAFEIVAEFSAKDTVAAERDKRVLRWQESGCGSSPVVKTSTMLLDDPVLQPDFVVEFAPDGKVLRRWGKPFNAPLGYLAGDKIVFELWESDGKRMLRYFTDTQGGIGPMPNTTVAVNHPAIGDGRQIDCPTIDLFGEDADYLQCFEAVDVITDKTHNIAFEAACT